MELPGDSDSFTGAEGDRISASFGLSEKQLGAKKLFSSLDLREQELAIGALLVLRSVRDRQLLECEEKASYFTVMLQKLLPRMGPACVDSVLALLKNEQLAEAPISSFVNFFSGLQAKLRGLSPVRIVEMTELVRRAAALDIAAYSEALGDLVFRESRGTAPMHSLLSQLFFEGGLPEFQSAELEARFPAARGQLSELDMKLGRLMMDEMLASEPGYDAQNAELARTAVHMLLGVRDDSPRQLYAQLLRGYERGRVCAPLELVLHGVLSSYVRAAGNTLHSLLLGLSLLLCFKPEIAGVERALSTVLVAVRALFQLGSLLAVKVNAPLISLSRTALLCSEQFRDSEARCSTIDCSKMWSFKNARDPWLGEWVDWTSRPVAITRNFSLLSYGSQPRGLLGSDVWMTLRWAGVNTGHELAHPDQNRVLADRLGRLSGGGADPTLDLALEVELGVRETPVEALVEEPAQIDPPVIEEPAQTEPPAEPASDNFLTLDPADDDWANWTT